MGLRARRAAPAAARAAGGEVRRLRLRALQAPQQEALRRLEPEAATGGEGQGSVSEVGCKRITL